MTAALYTKTKARLMIAEIDLTGVDVRAALIDTDEYAFDESHEFFDEIPAEAVIAISEPLTATDVNLATATFHSGNPLFLGVTGSEFEGIMLFIDSGEPETSRLLMFQDEEVEGLPFDPSYGEHNVRILVNENGWFRL